MRPPDSADYREIIRDIARSRGTVATVFADFCRMAACALAAQTREEEYLEVAGRYSKDELGLVSKALASLILEMERKPFEDLLGPLYQEVAAKATRDARGEFYTPRPISQAMARMLFNADKVKEDNRTVSFCDPACGAGGMVLAFAELLAPSHVHLLRATCWDINPVAADMCYVNTTLWGIPAEIVWGDSLRATVHGSWRNIHWARVGEDTRRLLNGISQDAPPIRMELPAEREELCHKARIQMELGL
jgi:type I restriction-modification system DNA methylase subunit